MPTQEIIRRLPADTPDDDFTQAEIEMREELSESSGVDKTLLKVWIYGVGVYDEGDDYVMRAFVPPNLSN